MNESALARGLAVFLGLFTCMFAAACIATRDVAMDDKGAQKFYDALAAPRDLNGLLRNLKIAMDAGALVREDFYTEEHLRRFLGAAKVHWRPPSLQRTWGSVIEFEFPVQPRFSARMSEPGISVSFYRVVAENQTVRGSFDVEVRSPGRTDFNEIERIFGSRWEYMERGLPSPHSLPVPPATRRYGNSWIIYNDVRPLLLRESRFFFDPNANLQRATLGMETRK